MSARLIGYTRVSRWGGPAQSGQLDEQRRELEQAFGADLTGIETDRLAGRSLRRPGLQAALDACIERRANGIAVTGLDRLSRSLDDLAELFALSREHGFRIVAPAQSLDTATASGALVASVLAEAGSWGRRTLTRERARSAFAPAEVAARIRAMSRDGATLQAICDALNADNIPTPRGGALWRPTSLRAVLRPLTEGETF